jgi:hypothetical protein
MLNFEWKGQAAAARFWMESPVLSRHSPGRRGIVPAEAGSAANECWMLDVELIGVFDRINRICRIYRAGAKRRQPEAIFMIVKGVSHSFVHFFDFLTAECALRA